MLISLENVSKSFGEKLILSGVNITIEDNDRIGLIGANGVGKSTLLNVICGRLVPDYSHHEQGYVHIGTGVSIGLLEQNSGLSVGNTIYSEMRSVFAEVLAAEEKLRALEKEIAVLPHSDDEYHKKAEEYSRLTAYFEASDGYHIDVKIKTVLNGMGFFNKAYDTIIDTLSGGEKTRLALAKLLLEEPKLLILDEPTNHLDFKTLMWLEDYLTGYKGGLLVVSHDRYFLDKMVTRIWEIENKKVESYTGNYSKYKQLRAEKIARALKEYEAQQNKIHSMMDFAQRNIARATTSNMAKSRLHQLEHIDVMEKPSLTIPTPHFSFGFERNPVKDLLTVEKLSLKVGDNITLCENISLEVKRGDKVALIGPNGIGKSTLLKALLGLSQQQGEIRWGGGVQTAYYEQENRTLNPENTAMDELWDRFPSLPPVEVRSTLGQVLITGENVFKKVGVLSGGERARVAFAIMMTERANTLILDEPTNHLDLQSKEELEKSLVEFEGSMILVSHDRYFLNAIPNKIIELSKNGLKLYKGNFDFYMEEVKKEQAAQAGEQVRAQEKSRSTEDKNSFYRSKQERREEAQRKTMLKKLEQEIEMLDGEIYELENSISSPEISCDYEKVAELCTELEQKKALHDEKFAAWAELSE